MLSPGLGVAHLAAGDPVRVHHLGEACAWGKEVHVDGAAEVNQLQTDRVIAEHLISRVGIGWQTGDALQDKVT